MWGGYLSREHQLDRESHGKVTQPSPVASRQRSANVLNALRGAVLRTNLQLLRADQKHLLTKTGAGHAAKENATLNSSDWQGGSR